MKIARTNTWHADLLKYAQDVARREFKPGQHDCALFTAGAVKAMTGVDLARGWRSKYRSLKRGHALLRENGFPDLASLVAEHFQEIPSLSAQVGDIAIIEQDGEQALGIVQGRYAWVLHVGGLGVVDLTNIARAFRV